MTAQESLVNILKKKGTGPTMSKSLSSEELNSLTNLMKDRNANITTKATLLTAFLMLENTEEESKWFSHFLTIYPDNLPSELHWLLKKTSTTPFEALILKVIDHHDLSYQEMTWAIEQVLNPAIPNIQKAAFLEAERLKRETLDENKAALNACLQTTISTQTDIPVLIDLSVAYDGLSRTPCVWVAVAALLASLGYPCVLHGVDEVSPKRGINAYKILSAAGIDPLVSVSQAITRLTTPSIGWAYIDQSQTNPALYALNQLRKDMVKRPIIATIEKLLQPIKGRETITVTSYTHPPYKDKMVQLLYLSSPSRFLLLRGVEGSIQLPTDRRAPAISWVNSTLSDDFVRPDRYETDKYPDGPTTAAESLHWCYEGLKGNHPYATPWISYLAHTILTQLHLEPPTTVYQKIETALKSGKAISQFI